MKDRSNGGEEGVGKQVTSEHRRLEALFHRTRAAFVRPSGQGEANEAFCRLREAVERHLAQEDSLYYPPIWTLRPQHKDALQAFVQAHDDFRSRLGEIAARLVRGARAEVLGSFDAFVDVFGRHEVGEELFLERIERELRLG